jgi:hypothetical protein
MGISFRAIADFSTPSSSLQPDVCLGYRTLEHTYVGFGDGKLFLVCS